MALGIFLVVLSHLIRLVWSHLSALDLDMDRSSELKRHLQSQIFSEGELGENSLRSIMRLTYTILNLSVFIFQLIS